jgi:hypothetical protein
VAKNHRLHKIVKRKKLEQASGTAMGSVSQLPPPPPAPPAPEMMPPPPPAPQFDSAAQMQGLPQADSSGSNMWMYIAIAVAAGLVALGFRFRAKFVRKSRRLVYAK